MKNNPTYYKVIYDDPECPDWAIIKKDGNVYYMITRKDYGKNFNPFREIWPTSLESWRVECCTWKKLTKKEAFMALL